MIQNNNQAEERYTSIKRRLLQHRLLWFFIRFVILNYYILEAVLSSTFYSMYVITETTLLPLNILFLIFLFLDFLYKICLTPSPKFPRLNDYKRIRKILKHYLIRHHLILDLTVYVLFLVSYVVEFGVARVLRLVIVLRFGEIIAFNEAIYQRIHTYPNARKLYTIVKICYVMFLFSHYFGCWFYLMDQVAIDHQTYGPVNTGNERRFFQLFVVYYQMNMLCFTPIEALDDGGRYLYGLYFLVSLISTIAYGDIVGKNPIEEVYVTILMILSTISIGLILEQFMLVVRGDSMGLYEFIKNYNCLKTKMDDSGLDWSIQNKVRSYLVYMEYQQQFHAHDPIVEKLSSKLRNDLTNEGYNSYIGPIFAQLGFEKVYQLCSYCNQCTYQAQTYIFDPDDEGTAFKFLYLIQGTVVEYLTLSNSVCELPTHRKHFNLGKLILNCRLDPEELMPIYQFNARRLKCIKLSQFIFMDPEDFEKFVHHEDDIWRIRQLRESIVCQQTPLPLFGEECSICPSPNNLDHCCQECPALHYVVKETVERGHQLSKMLDEWENKRAMHERKNTRSKKIRNYVRQKQASNPTQNEKGGERAAQLTKRLIQLKQDDPNRKDQTSIDFIDGVYFHQVRISTWENRQFSKII